MFYSTELAKVKGGTVKILQWWFDSDLENAHRLLTGRTRGLFLRDVIFSRWLGCVLHGRYLQACVGIQTYRQTYGSIQVSFSHAVNCEMF
jgi:hypothetical protein